jgi:membrane-associated phospholipid phosphatase
MAKFSNMGDMGDVGSLGSGTPFGGGGIILPDRVNLPFATEDARTWELDGYKGGKWKLGGGTLNHISHQATAVWQPRDWKGSWAAWLVLAEYAATDWRSIALKLWQRGEQEKKEIAALVRAAQDERADALSEILAQNTSYEDFMVYFLALLRITPNSHPKTVQLLHIAGLVGILSAMHFKRYPGNGRKPRARPSQVHPALMPPVEVPGHPSFPSGHATQAMLMALSAEAALPTPALQEAWRPLLQTLAGRIARNREIAGLHYESDTHGGLELAYKAFTILATCEGFKNVQKAAGKEW